MIAEMVDALQAGKQLENSAGWKNAQSTANNVASILFGLLAVFSLIGFHPAITHEQILAIAGGVAACLGVFNSYATVATSAKVGLPPRTGNPNPPSGDDALGI